MKLSTMRRVDYWIGVPLCALVSLVLWLVRCMRPSRTNAHTPRRVLLIELSEMGSALLAYPSMCRLREQYQGVELFFLIFDRNRESVDLLGILPPDHVLTIKDDDLLCFSLSLMKLCCTLWRVRCDVAIDLELFSRCTALLALLSGAKIRVGFDNGRAEGLYRGTLHTHRVLFNHHRHMSENFMAMVEALRGIEDPPYVKLGDFPTYPLPIFNPTSAQVERIHARLKARGVTLSQGADLVLLNPDPGILALRGWPIENYAELSRILLDRFPKIIILIIGLPAAEQFARQIMDRVPSQRLVNFVGGTDSLSELLTLLSLARVLVTSDSGAAHFASMSRIHNFVFFGPETPALYRPLGERTEVFFQGLACSPCLWAENHRDSSCRDNVCVRSISAQAVAERVTTRVPIKT